MCPVSVYLLACRGLSVVAAGFVNLRTLDEIISWPYCFQARPTKSLNKLRLTGIQLSIDAQPGGIALIADVRWLLIHSSRRKDPFHRRDVSAVSKQVNWLWFLWKIGFFPARQTLMPKLFAFKNQSSSSALQARKQVLSFLNWQAGFEWWSSWTVSWPNNVWFQLSKWPLVIFIRTTLKWSTSVTCIFNSRPWPWPINGLDLSTTLTHQRPWPINDLDPSTALTLQRPWPLNESNLALVQENVQRNVVPGQLFSQTAVKWPVVIFRKSNPRENWTCKFHSKFD